MKFTLSWLKEHLETDASLSEIVDAMTLAGLEVEEVHNPADELAAFSIAKVKTAEKHPDADKLKVCTVDTRDGEMQIVCGAPNARAGMTVAYAPMGAYIPGADFSLDKKPRKIRGVDSSGMMCSARELNMGEEHDGIMDLDSSLEMGTPLADAIGLNDPVIDFEVTPNRPDWLGVDGIARDLAAVGLGKLITPAVPKIKGTFPCPQKIEIDAPTACPTFAGRVVRGVKNGPSPKWLQEKLTAIGLRPISALVDITNYMSYDRDRPLHVYDMAKLSGPIRARMGKSETFTALDDKEYSVSEDDCAIADDSGVLGLGGIMGGTSSGCTESTTDVFIESAYFDPLTIRKTAKRLGLNSDAKYRFERGVDSGFVLGGLDMATQLILDICGGEPSEIEMAGEIMPAPQDIAFNPELTARLTGLNLKESAVETILNGLGFDVKSKGKTWTVGVPSFRRDAREGADLVEDIARIHGFHNLEALSLPPLPGRREPTATLTQNRTRLARRALAGRGLSEAITWAFVLQDHAKVFGGGADDMRLDNPISAELNCMRPSALIHLLLAGQRNSDKGYGGSALFELGGTYHSQEPDGQKMSLAGVRFVITERHWKGASEVDALTAKADALAALAAMGAAVDNLQLSKPGGAYWHPGRSGRLQMGPKNILADFGELHPRALKALGIEGRVTAFEIWPESLPAPRKKKSGGKAKSALTLSELMPVHRDFAFIAPNTVAAGDILKAARGADKQLITGAELFDIYEGKGVEEGHRSLAIDVTLSPKDATLTDKEIEAVSERIIAQVAKAGGVLRG